LEPRLRTPVAEVGVISRPGGDDALSANPVAIDPVPIATLLF
jgi:hypothetical protein